MTRAACLAYILIVVGTLELFITVNSDNFTCNTTTGTDFHCANGEDCYIYCSHSCTNSYFECPHSANKCNIMCTTIDSSGCTDMQINATAAANGELNIYVQGSNYAMSHAVIACPPNGTCSLKCEGESYQCKYGDIDATQSNRLSINIESSRGLLNTEIKCPTGENTQCDITCSGDKCFYGSTIINTITTNGVPSNAEMNLNFTGLLSASNAIINCGDDNCQVSCNGERACENTEINGGSARSLLVLASGSYSLDHASIYCPSPSPRDTLSNDDDGDGDDDNCHITVANNGTTSDDMLIGLSIYAVDSFADLQLECFDDALALLSNPNMYCGAGLNYSCPMQLDRNSYGEWHCLNRTHKCELIAYGDGDGDDDQGEDEDEDEDEDDSANTNNDSNSFIFLDNIRKNALLYVTIATLVILVMCLVLALVIWQCLKNYRKYNRRLAEIETKLGIGTGKNEKLSPKTSLRSTENHLPAAVAVRAAQNTNIGVVGGECQLVDAEGGGIAVAVRSDDDDDKGDGANEGEQVQQSVALTSSSETLGSPATATATITGKYVGLAPDEFVVHGDDEANTIM